MSGGEWGGRAAAAAAVAPATATSSHPCTPLPSLQAAAADAKEEGGLELKLITSRGVKVRAPPPPLCCCCCCCC